MQKLGEAEPFIEGGCWTYTQAGIKDHVETATNLRSMI
jgi:hypothetical protein